MNSTVTEPSAAPAPSGARTRPLAGWIGLAASVVIIVSTVLAWVEVGFLGTTSSVSGLDTDDGKIVAVAGAIGAVLSLAALGTRGARWLYVAVLVGAVTTAIAAYDIADIESTAGDLGADEAALFSVEAGIGIWAALAGAVALTFAGVWAFVERRRGRSA